MTQDGQMHSRTTARYLHKQLKQNEQSAIPGFVAQRRRQSNAAEPSHSRPHQDTASPHEPHKSERFRLNYKDMILLMILAFFVFGLASAVVRAQSDITEAPLLQLVQRQSTLEASGISSRLDVSIQGPLATVRVDQWFVNPGLSVMNAHYTFPVSDQAIITDLRTITADHEIRALIKQWELAQTEFAEASEHGQTASLIEPHQHSGLITSRISNTPAGDLVQTHLTYVQPVQYSDGEFVLRIPMTYRPRHAQPPPLQDHEPFRPRVITEQAVLHVGDSSPHAFAIRQPAQQLLSVYASDPVTLPQTATPAVMNALLGLCLLLVGWALVRRMKDPS